MGIPGSILLGLSKRSNIRAHLDHLVGESNHTSPLKEMLIEELRQIGSVWMEECEQCKKDGTLLRKQEREKWLALQEAERIVET